MITKKKKKKIDNRQIFLNSILVAASIALIFTITGYLKEGLVAAAASHKYEETKTEAVNKETHDIDFTTIHADGSTATSWIYLPDTGIDYPMVQGPDNDTYLNVDAYGNPSKAGAIFINYANAGDMSDPKTIVFGHNMSNGSMFSPLHKYSDEKWGRMHTDAYVYMDNADVKHYKLRYYIFTDPTNEDVYVINKAEPGQQTAQKLQSCADIVYDDTYRGGRFMCLSTCTYHTKRTIVVFEEVDNVGPITGNSVKYEAENMVSLNAVSVDDFKVEFK